MKSQFAKILVIVFCFVVWGAGCNKLPAAVNLAETLSPTDQTRAAVKQNQGFGTLARLNMPNTHAQSVSPVVEIKAQLPTLLPTVTVVRVPQGTADRTQFGNLTSAFGLPAGALGNEYDNLTLSFTWTNNEGYVWSYVAEKSQVAFSNPAHALNSGTSTLDGERILRAARDFVVDHGFKESDYRNFALASSSLEFANLTAVTAERVVDQRNIVDRDGRPELGAVIYLNNSGKVASGWLALSREAQRSDYPAISEKTMRTSLELGGIAGPPSGRVEITETLFAFVKLPRQGKEPELLVPALVGEGIQYLSEGGSRPYRVVVPLVQ